MLAGIYLPKLIVFLTIIRRLGSIQGASSVTSTTPAQPVAQPVVQPVMAQPVTAQPMAQQMAQPATVLMQVTATVPGGQPMQLLTADGSMMTVMVPMGVQPGMQFQIQAAAPQLEAVPMAGVIA